jgi:MoaA/NifB/PqqE/SkfB family radical SAM enzyme
MFKTFYLGTWFLKARFMGFRQPLQTVLFVSDHCNLLCRHCNILKRDGRPPVTKTYQDIAGELKYAYGLGSRFVDFGGGEPFLWRDGERSLNDLFRLAKETGFYSTTVTTNAQQPFAGCEADSIWVSLDGVGNYHDQIRGAGTFDQLLKSLENCGHPAVSVNMVINKINYPAVRETIEFAAGHPVIKSISLNFHTPFPGTEDLWLDWGRRRAVIGEIIGLKKAGRPIMNSVSGLKLMESLDFTRQCWVTNFILADGTRLSECVGQSSGVCDRCGFGMAGEMNCLFRFKPDTIIAGLKVRGSQT